MWIRTLKNTTLKGDMSVAKMTVALMENSMPVMKPLSDGLRYDLVAEINGKLQRVQCKTGQLKRGAVRFRTYSISGTGAKPKNYYGEADLFGVYCPEIGKCFLVPVDEMGVGAGSLRINAPKNNQKKRVRLAQDYELRM